MPAHALPPTWPATPGLLAGRLALVTGAASGIGRAVAVAFAQAGARVIVTDLQADRCADTLRDVRAAGTEGWAWALDVSNAQACHDLATQVAQSVGDVERSSTTRG